MLYLQKTITYIHSMYFYFHKIEMYLLTYPKLRRSRMYSNLIKLAAGKTDEAKKKELMEESRRTGFSLIGGVPIMNRVNSKLIEALSRQRDSASGDTAAFQKILDNLKDQSAKVDVLPGFTSDYDQTTFHLKGKTGPGKKLTYAPNVWGLPDGASYSVPESTVEALTDEQRKQLNPNIIPEKGGRSGVVSVKTKDPATLLHEIGHETGGNRTDTLKHRIIKANKGLYAKSQAHAFTANPLVSAIAPSIASAMTKRKDNESEEDYLKRKQRNRHLTNAASALGVAPMLAEEARASIVAHKLGKKMGVPVDKKSLLTAFGTYGSTLIPNAVRAATDVISHKREMDSLKNKQKNS